MKKARTAKPSTSATPTPEPEFRTMVEFEEWKKQYQKEGREEALRIRYKVDPDIGENLAQLIEITHQLVGTDVKRKIVAFFRLQHWWLYVGRRICDEALDYKTDFLDELSKAIKNDAAGPTVNDKFRHAWTSATAAIMGDYLSAYQRGEHHMEDDDKMWPSITDIVNEYLDQHPKAKRESTETQVKRWVKSAGVKTVGKRKKRR